MQDLDLYRETLLESAKTFDEYGELKRVDEELVGKNASCGDSLVVQIQFSKNGKKIEALRWHGVGCVISRAAANAVVQLVSEQPEIKKIMTLRERDVAEVLGLQEISPGREKCLLLGLKTLQSGLASSVTANGV